MIICNRAPCNSQLNMSYNRLQIQEFRNQLDKLNPDKPVPAAYFGESSKSGFTRSLQHWGKYNTVSGQKTSFMWHHTVACHSGVIGANRGIDDYKFVMTGRFQSCLQRQSEEGRRTSVFEDYQSRSRIKVLNSKIDFVQPVRTKLVAIAKNINNKPGQADYITPARKRQRCLDPALPAGKRQRCLDPVNQSTPVKKTFNVKEPSVSPIISRPILDTFDANLHKNISIQLNLDLSDLSKR